MQHDRASSLSMWWCSGMAFCSLTKTVARTVRESRNVCGTEGDWEVAGRRRL